MTWQNIVHNALTSSVQVATLIRATLRVNVTASQQWCTMKAAQRSGAAFCSSHCMCMQETSDALQS